MIRHATCSVQKGPGQPHHAPKLTIQKSIRNLIIGINMVLLCTVAAVFIGCTTEDNNISSTSSSGWDKVPHILARIVPPSFPQRDYGIAQFGAIGDGRTNSRPAIQQAVDKCNSDGGGRVVVPAGTFYCEGPIHMKSHVHLFVSEGATIKFSAVPDHFLPMVLTKWEGTELYNYSPMIYAYQATDIAITGKGTIDGGASKSFANWKPDQKPDQNKLRQMGNDGVPVYQRVFGKGHWLRPSFIQPFGCKNVLIEGLTLLDSPFWVIHPTYCINVTVRNIKVDSWNPNNDGCDPDASVDVLIENCEFITGDDAVAIKAGRDQDGWRVGQATENVVIRNCDMRSKANGLCIGSEMSGGVRNVFMENCRVREAGSTVYFKSNLDRGGVIENVWVRDVTVDRAVSSFVRFESNYKGHRGNHFPPVFRNFNLERLTCRQADNYAIYAVGHEDALLENITFKDVEVDQARVPLYLKFARNFITDNVKIGGGRLSLKPEMTKGDGTQIKMKW